MKKIINGIKMHSLVFFALINLLLIPIFLLLDVNGEMYSINVIAILTFWYYFKTILYSKLFEVRA